MVSKILVTGGCGFIGSNFLNIMVPKYKRTKFLNIDKLTYAGKSKNVRNLKNLKNYNFLKIDICNNTKLQRTIKKFNPEIVIHFAAESHVDNSIKSPGKFIQSNILGTYNILRSINKKIFLVHISTDEVYGHAINNKSFSETTKYNPRSPYSASKASADHLVSAWNSTYGYKSTIVNCCNNFGPNQDKEKFIPVIINSILNNKKIPIYGNGKQKREWIYVDDFISSLDFIISKNLIKENFVIGSGIRFENKIFAKKIIEIFKKKLNYNDKKIKLIRVKDRPGHDLEYKVNCSKIKKLGWQTKTNIVEDLIKTINYYKFN
ncbi:GDP-mannose 4,6-dehydratase [bacterium]|nr:GDP-mannose 4,6-dehydratase [bacterium]MDB4812338.1 GDP-mannose 4,6-dehydratase [Candidatus Pelagibacter sp.]